MRPLRRRPRILFVDDEVDVVDILARTFERSYEVLTATSASQALELLRAQPVDLLVTDQKMPEMTGIDLAARARAEGIDVTTILLTAYTEPQDIIDAINKGQVFRYVTKPWDVTELMVTVKNALDQHFLRQERERLLGEMCKRVDALNLLYEVSRSGAALASYEAIIGRVVEAFASIVPFDIGASLVAIDSGKQATLQLDCRAEAAEGGLLAAKQKTLQAWSGLSQATLSEDRLVVRVTGRQATAGPAATGGDAFASQLAAPLTVDGRPAGVIVLFSFRPDAFDDGDAKLLELLANQTAAAVRNLTAVLDSERRRIERMVECMADGVVLTDARNEIVVANAAARQMLRMEAEPATARRLQEVLGFDPFDLVRGWEYGGPQTLREELRLFDRTLVSTVSPVTDRQGALLGVVLLLRDVSEQKLLEERKEELVSIISHELRTPLTAISGALDLVLNEIAGGINEKQRRFLDMARESTDRLNGMVDDLLDLSKLARGKLRMNYQVVELDGLVRAAAERYAAAASRRGVSITVQAPSAPLRVVADPNRLGQVLDNLLTNALKYSPDGGRIELELARPAHVGAFACLSCANDGDPIPEGDLERIFEKFEQGSSPRTRAVRGTGLGLAICKSIVEAHGGQIWAQNDPGLGPRFVVVLPVEPVEAAASGRADETPPAPARKGRVGTVLVVDDEPDIGFILKALLLSRGHRALLARSADEAIALARRHHPDVVASDVRMPHVDGIALAEILRHDPDTRDSKLLVFSVFDERERAFKSGASAFLQKPLDVPRFLATVEGLLVERRGPGILRVLVVDDDASVRSICAEVLTSSGFEVLEASTCAAAAEAVREKRPDLILLDLVLPDGDGFTFLDTIKPERAARHLSVIFITAKGETASKVRALKLGADDYLVKPFDALELAARVETVLRRKEAELGASPTTRLPGSAAIERDVMLRLEDGRPFALCYLDLDNLKAYNDHYGYAKADGVVQQTGDLLREVIIGEGTFIGHIAGDDFVFITPIERVEPLCQQVVDSFDRIIPLYYDAEDRERGCIEGEDRFGQRRQFPIMSVSVAAVLQDGSFKDHAELSRAAAELKKRAKAIPGSKFVRSDREEVRFSSCCPANARARAVAVAAEATAAEGATGAAPAVPGGGGGERKLG